jgi:hypothetical protein
VSVMTLACIAVLAIVGLAFYAIHRKVGLKVSARALRQFEVSIEVASQSGSHHGRLSTEPGDDPRSLGQPDNQTRADRRARSNQPIAIPERSPGRLSSRASRRSGRQADQPGTARRTDKSGSS